MCGIAGWYGRPEASDEPARLLRRMIGTIAHRGPDATGIHVEDGVGFAHARLSIIDLGGGAQPMADAGDRVWVTFNGEIFNYVELRRDLIALGRPFRTDSDTEVILQAYLAWGPDCVTRFNGDFAFALWDRDRKLFMMARDRMGVRPLFYVDRPGCLFFASEIKALFAAPGVTAELDPIALDQIFTLWAPIAPRTPFVDVRELPPAHVMVATPDGTCIRPYWRLDFPDANDHDALDDRSEDDIATDVAALLEDATRIRLRADVPVGAYLSGGLDSSIITALMKRISPCNLRSFSVGFESAEFDEREFQAAMVTALGTDHSEVVCTSADIGRRFPEIIAHTERPVLRTGPAPLYLLAEMVRRQGYKVVLTGEGADEVFAGYDIFKEAKLRRFCAARPDAKWRTALLQRLYPYMPGHATQSQRYREAFFLGASDDLADPLFSHLPRVRTTTGTKAFYSAAMRETLRDYDALADLRASLPADFTRWHPLSQAQYLETTFLLPGYILSSQGDRVAMAHAVEGRFPFLDPRVIDQARLVPPRFKLKAMREKAILRRAVRDLLPAIIAERPKQPYRAPDSQSFVGTNAPDYVTDMLSPASLARFGLFEPGPVGKLVKKCTAGTFVGARDNMALVGILSTQLLGRRFVEADTSRERSTRAA